MTFVMRHVLKLMLERVRVIGAERSLRKLGQREATLVLAYHNVMAERSRAGGDTSLHLRFDQFRRQLDQLQRCSIIVPLDDLMGGAALPAFTADRPRVAITFDDAYADALSVALPELVARGLAATVFVAPGLLGSQGTWWDLYLSTASPHAESRRNHALDALAGSTVDIAAHASAHDWLTSAGAAIASEAELDRAAMLPGVTFGAHSMTHPNLARLDARTLEWELATSLQWLQTRYANFRPWLAYPYGLTNSLVAGLAQRTGYSAGFLVEGAWATNGHAAFAWPRMNVPAGVSDRGFLLRLAAR